MRAFLMLLFLLNAPIVNAATGVTYHLHNEVSAINSSNRQLKAGGPDAGWTSIQQPQGILNGGPGEYVIAKFETQTGVPGTAGTIPAGSAVTVNIYAYQHPNCTFGGCPTLTPVYFRFKLYLNSASGLFLCSATAAAQLGSGNTPNLQTVTCTIPNAVTVTSSDRFFLWTGVNSVGNAGQMAGVSLEGTTGQYDSTIVAPPIVRIPSLTSLTPTSGPVATSVQINGTNLNSDQPSTVVKFNGVVASPIQWQGNKITVAVPAGGNDPAVFPGEQPESQTGPHPNLYAGTLSLLSGAQLAPTATVIIKACNAGSGGRRSIAQLLADRLQREVKAYATGMFFSTDPNAISSAGAPKTIPNNTPIYMLPEGGGSIRRFCPGGPCAQ